MSELLDLAAGLAGRAEAEEDVEAYLTHDRDFSAKVHGGEVESIVSAEPRGAALRVVRDHKVGFAYTTDLSEAGLAALVDQARENSRHSTEDDAVGLPEPRPAPGEPAGLVDPSQSEVSADAKVAFALELERLTKEGDSRIRTVEEAVYSDSETEVAIASSKGIAGAYRRTDAWCYAVAIATDGEDTEVGFDFDLARGMAFLDREEVARRATERAVLLLGATKIPSAKMPVILDPYAAGQFLGVLGSALTGEAVQKGRSLFAGRLGEEVASARLALVDDGRAEGAPAAAPWDAEGVPTQRTDVIRDGFLRSFLYDVKSARREGRSSTGNAARGGFKAPPGPSPSNLAFESTGESGEEVLRRAGSGLLVQDFHGVHSGANPVSGDFSVGVTGRLCRGGAPEQPVKEVTIALPMLEMLRSVEAVANDRRWLPFGGSYGGATTLIAEMTVAGA